MATNIVGAVEGDISDPGESMAVDEIDDVRFYQTTISEGDIRTHLSLSCVEIDESFLLPPEANDSLDPDSDGLISSQDIVNTRHIRTRPRLTAIALTTRNVVQAVAGSIRVAHLMKL